MQKVEIYDLTLAWSKKTLFEINLSLPCQSFACLPFP